MAYSGRFETNDKGSFFLYGFKINYLVKKSSSFVAVFILKSLAMDGILMTKLSIEFGLVTSEVASLNLYSSLLLVMERGKKIA